MRGTVTLTEYTDSVTVYAIRKPIAQSEFFAAGQNGIKPAWVYEVRTAEYNNQSELNDGERDYTIYRTYPRRDGWVELYCEVRRGD